MTGKPSSDMWRRSIVFASVIGIVCAQYEVPAALIEPLSPRGFRVSIPDEEGIKLFAFHAKLNEEMNGREGGTFSRDILKPINGRWTFIDKVTKLKPGDVLYYWTYVDYFDGERKLGYVRDDQMFTVEELIADPTVSTTSTERTTTTRRSGGNATPSCLTTPTKMNGRKSCAGKMIFQENFGNNFSNNRKWEIEVRYAGEPDYEFTIYTDNSENIYTYRNILFIKPTLTEDRYGKSFTDSTNGLDFGTNCTGIPGTPECFQRPQAYVILPPAMSARINTKNHFSFIYGVIEVRAKMPKGDWIYPEIFLNPKVNDYGAGYESGQIRIAFVPGNYQMNKKLYGGCILGSSTAARNFAISSKELNTSWGDDFHTYTVKWEPESLTMSVDGEIYGRIYPPAGGFATQEHNLGLTAANRWRSGTRFAPFDKEMYITIGVGVGGHNFQDSESKPWINNDPKGQKLFYRSKDKWHATWGTDSILQVDYIKVTAL